MSEKQPPQEAHKFDTLSLLAGLSDADTEQYSLDEILNEYREADQGTKSAPAEPDNSIIDQIQHAIDREMEMNMATPEPVIQLERETPEPPEQDLGDPELNDLFRRSGIRIVDHAQPPQQAAPGQALRLI